MARYLACDNPMKDFQQYNPRKTFPNVHENCAAFDPSSMLLGPSSSHPHHLLSVRNQFLAQYYSSMTTGGPFGTLKRFYLQGAKVVTCAVEDFHYPKRPAFEAESGSLKTELRRRAGLQGSKIRIYWATARELLGLNQVIISVLGHVRMTEEDGQTQRDFCFNHFVVLVSVSGQRLSGPSTSSECLKYGIVSDTLTLTPGFANKAMCGPGVFNGNPHSWLFEPNSSEDFYSDKKHSTDQGSNPMRLSTAHHMVSLEVESLRKPATEAKELPPAAFNQGSGLPGSRTYKKAPQKWQKSPSSYPHHQPAYRRRDRGGGPANGKRWNGGPPSRGENQKTDGPSKATDTVVLSTFHPLAQKSKEMPPLLTDHDTC